MIFILFQIILVLASCIYFISKNNKTLSTDLTLVDFAKRVVEKYKYLARDKLKFAVFDCSENAYIVYSTDGENEIERLGRDNDHEIGKFFYDTPSETFKELTQNQWVVDDDKSAITLHLQRGGREIINLNELGLEFDTESGTLKSHETCQEGQKYSVNMEQYKAYYSTPSDDDTGSVRTHPRLYFSCIDGRKVISKCDGVFNENEQKCIDVVETPAPQALTISIARNVTSFVKVESNIVHLVDCTNGVDETGIECNDVRCLNKNGENLIDMIDGGFNKISNQAKLNSGTVICRRGQVERVIECDCTPQEFFIRGIGLNVFERKIIYPKQRYAKKTKKCVVVKRTQIAPLFIPVTVHSYRAASNTFMAKIVENDKITWSQNVKFNDIKDGDIVPDIYESTKFYRQTGPFKVSMPSIVYQNQLYNSSIRLPKINTNSNSFDTVTVKRAEGYYSMVGNIILDFTEFLPTDSRGLAAGDSLENAMIEAINMVPDDFYHLPSIFYYLKETEKNGTEMKPFIYKNTATIYGLPKQEMKSEYIKHLSKYWDNFELFKNEV